MSSVEELHSNGDCGFDCPACAEDDGLTVIDRDTWEADVIYVNLDGSALRTPDGIGAYFYDSEEEAIDDHLEDGPEVVYLDRKFVQ